MAKPLLCVGQRFPRPVPGLSLAILGDYVLAARLGAISPLAYGGVGPVARMGGADLAAAAVGRVTPRPGDGGDQPVASGPAGRKRPRIGLVTRVVDDEALPAEADSLAATAGGHRQPRGRPHTPAVCWQVLRPASIRRLQLEARGNRRRRLADPDGREGVAAFLERRKPCLLDVAKEPK